MGLVFRAARGPNHDDRDDSFKLNSNSCAILRQFRVLNLSTRGSQLGLSAISSTKLNREAIIKSSFFLSTTVLNINMIPTI